MEQKFYVARVDASFDTDPMTDESKVIEGMEDVELLRLTCKNEDEIIEKAQDVDVIITMEARITDRVMAALPRLKGVVRYGVGYDTIDVPGATRNGVLVVNVPDFCFEEVSNHVIMFLLSFAKHLQTLNEVTKQGKWAEAKAKQSPTFSPFGKTLGIVGCGNLGRAVARKAKAFGMEIIGYDKYLPEHVAADAGIQLVSFDELLSRSDYVTLHCVLTDETRHMFNDEAFAKMKKNAVLINAARGPVVDEKALVKALSDGEIAGACLDVFEQEPTDPQNPLFGFENVLVTPHCASYSEEAFTTLRTTVMEEAVRMIRGERPLHVVNRDVLQSAVCRV